MNQHRAEITKCGEKNCFFAVKAQEGKPCQL